MRATEFITEYIVKTFNIEHEFLIHVDDHFMVRSKERNVPYNVSGRILEKLINIAHELAEVEPGQQIWVFDKEANVRLGLRKKMNSGYKMQFVLKTVVNSPQWDSPNPEYVV